jgi:hypothetical protein
MNSEKDFLMFYQSSLRNVALFTSVSLGLQTYSSHIKNKYKSFIIYCSYLFFLAIAIYLNYLLITQLHTFDKEDLNNKYLSWLNIPYLTLIFLILMTLINLPTFIKKIISLIKK